MNLQPIWWDAEELAIGIIDQTLLPTQRVDRVVRTTAELVTAIQELAVRGAPALGVTGAYAVALAVAEGERAGWSGEQVAAAIRAVRQARPTAVNLAWGVDQVAPLVPQGFSAVLAAADTLAREAVAAERGLSVLAADWILERAPRARVRALTHCNAGALATAGWGTALGVLRELHDRGRLEMVYADETRPLLQGSRLTAYELSVLEIPHLVQPDSAAASTILRGLVDVAVVGADRIAANGDTANKVGTLGVGLACAAAGIPLVVAAPWSTVDLDTAWGEQIEIEQRSADEVVSVGGRRVAPEGSGVHNPAFDVTPASYVSLIVTERGLIEPATGATPASFRTTSEDHAGERGPRV